MACIVLRPIMKMTRFGNGLVIGFADCVNYAGLGKTLEKLFKRKLDPGRQVPKFTIETTLMFQSNPLSTHSPHKPSQVHFKTGVILTIDRNTLAPMALYGAFGGR